VGRDRGGLGGGSRGVTHAEGFGLAVWRYDFRAGIRSAGFGVIPSIGVGSDAVLGTQVRLDGDVDEQARDAAYIDAYVKPHIEVGVPTHIYVNAYICTYASIAIYVVYAVYVGANVFVGANVPLGDIDTAASADAVLTHAVFAHAVHVDA